MSRAPHKLLSVCDVLSCDVFSSAVMCFGLECSGLVRAPGQEVKTALTKTFADFADCADSIAKKSVTVLIMTVTEKLITMPNAPTENDALKENVSRSAESTNAIPPTHDAMTIQGCA